MTWAPVIVLPVVPKDVKRSRITEIRAHSVEDWNATLTIRPHQHGYLLMVDDDAGVVLSTDRMRGLAHAMLEAIGDTA